jgi:hypothetical protein
MVEVVGSNIAYGDRGTQIEAGAKYFPSFACIDDI